MILYFSKKKRLSNIYLSLGSNIGDKIFYIKQAICLISKDVGKVKKISDCYETEAWGPIAQASYINCVIRIESALSPGKLLKSLLAIEEILGRTREIRYGPRSIDIDILLVGSKIINQKILQVPHPLFHKRKFVLVPLNDIAADALHPILSRTTAELLASCEDTGNVNKLKTTISL